jgi:HD-GYP domain-containing protein (c-di-GMP phosphodiesterase class II)
MAKFLVTTLVKGKVFSSPLYLDEKYILLSPEVPISEVMIDRLIRWNYPYLFSDGDMVDAAVSIADGGDGGGALLESEMKEQADFARAFKFYQDFINFTEGLFTDFINRNILPVNDVSGFVKQVIEVVREQRNYILRISEMDLADKTFLVVQSVRTTILGVALAMFAKLPNHKIIEVGMTCLLHEIGMVRLPPQLYNSNKVLTPQEKRAISAHTVLGYNILKNANFPMAVCLGVLESHENVDGSGYPRKVPGDKMSVYAKIVAICSSYAALSSARPFRLAFDGHHTIIELLKHMGRRYDETLVRLLVANLSIYPIGTYVQLANGAKGMVIQANEQNPREPVVRLLVSPAGERYNEAPIIKTDSPELRIARALTVQQVAELRKTYNLKH